LQTGISEEDYQIVEGAKVQRIWMLKVPRDLNAWIVGEAEAKIDLRFRRA
jgi:hypothetical protein